MQRFACALGSLALVSLASAPALAACPDGTLFCAQAGAQVIPGVQANGQITIGLPQLPVPMAQPPAVQPAPQYEYPYAAPQAPQYYYQPRPVHVYRAPSYPASRFAIDLRLDGAASFRPNASGSTYGMGGAGLGFRYRATRHFAFEAGADIMGGSDYYNRRSLDLSGNLGGLLYVNPRSRVQFYLDAGGLVDYARSTASSSSGLPTEDVGGLRSNAATTYTHLGGYAGLGLEMFATRHIAFHLDAKGIVRGKVGGSTEGPEFVEPGTGRSTSVSGGFVGQAGMLFYF